jgi:chromosome segregation ATPase
MPNQNDNQIEALRIEAEALNTLTREFQNKLNALAIPDTLVFDIDEQDLLEQRLDEEANEKALAARTKKLVKIEAEQSKIVEQIMTLESVIAEHDAKIESFKKKKQKLQDKVEAEKYARTLLVGQLKTQRKKLLKLGSKIDTTFVYNESVSTQVTLLPEYTDEGARTPAYHISAPSTDLGTDWSDKWQFDRRGNREH